MNMAKSLTRKVKVGFSWALGSQPLASPYLQYFPYKVSAPWMTVRTIQKEVWMMLDRDTDVNVVVKMLEEKAK